jgi:hypothetical protein
MKRYLLIILLAMLMPLYAAESIDVQTGTRDPTQPPNVTAAPKQAKAAMATNQETLQVQAILTSEGRQVAIVSGKVVKVGDIIRGIKVVAITPEYVEFADFDRHFKVQLFLTTLKPTPREVIAS